MNVLIAQVKGREIAMEREELERLVELLEKLQNSDLIECYTEEDDAITTLIEVIYENL